MPDAFHAEFTGERVIPGRVEDNLFNEHLARYLFARRIVRDLGMPNPILDAGCGAGYGAAELAQSGAEVLGIDVSADAIAHARANYTDSNLRFEEASCTAIPGADNAFQVIAAFEVIEHLSNWRDFLAEARRVLDPVGLFLVSTPNRLYYAESRQKAGPNPFHVHEFTEEEFRSELQAYFPYVKILQQNHVEGIAFSGADAEGTAFEITPRTDDPSSAHFFLAVCGKIQVPTIEGFVFIPDSGNVLQTRERHIALLDGEIQKKNQWIETEKLERGRMMDKVRDLEAELETHNRWARAANEEAERRARLVADLQSELRKSNEWTHAEIIRLEAELRQSNEWAKAETARMETELRKSNEWAQSRDAEAVERGLRVEQLQGEVAQATEWARARDAEAEERGTRVVELQRELAAEQENRRAAVEAVQSRLEREMAAASGVYEAAIAQWRLDKEASDRWAVDTERRLSAERDAAREAFATRQIELEIAQERMAALKAELEQLRAHAAEVDSRIDMVARSRWVRLGRTFRVGPEIGRT